MKPLLFPLLFVLVFNFTRAQVSPAERAALIALYNATDGPNWNDNTNWNSASTVDTWYGITVTSGSVTSIALNNNALNGIIPTEVGNLIGLTSFDLSQNQITGSIPPSIGNLVNCQSLRLYRNQISGSIPVEVGNMIALSRLDIPYNQLTGSIPPEVGNLTSLRYLLLHDNQLTGPISPSIGNLTQLELLYLMRNQISGTLPPELGNLSSLLHFWVSENQITGTIPPELGNLSNLVTLLLQENQMTGTLPPELSTIGSGTVQSLYFNDNFFEGTVPSSYASITISEILEISNNQFEFGDFENEFATYQANTGVAFRYSPQAKINTIDNLTRNTGQNVTLTTTTNGAQNHYQWFKNGVLIPGAPDSPSLVLTNVQSTDAGIYHCLVTSDIVTGLTLRRNDITLNLSAAPPSNPFVTTWKTDNPGSSGNNQIIIPTFVGETYNYTVDWGDGNITTGETGNAIHTYTTPGTYTVTISGVFPGINFNDTGDPAKILTIEQWGDNTWVSMENAFNGCINLQGNFTDIPDLSAVTSMAAMFKKARIFNSNIGNWDVSNVTDMSSMFDDAQVFAQDIGGWNVSNVTNMSSMFHNAYVFNQDIGSWNVSKVTDMSFMFNRASIFNQNIGNWNVSNVITMAHMFQEARVFNQDIGNWNIGNVTSTFNMFNAANRFNQDIGGWNVSNVTDIRRMFIHAHDFNQDIGAWDVSNITSMEGMFAVARSFNQDIGAWNVSNVTDMSIMFNSAQDFDQDLGNWNVQSLTDATNMFAGATLSIINYDALLIGWNAQNINPNVPFSGGNSQYCAGAAARANMIASDTWTITDGGTTSPDVFDLVDQTHVGSYTLPIITGTDLTGNEQYYTGINGSGTAYPAGSTINYADFPSYPITLHIYDEIGATPNCYDQEIFQLTLTNTKPQVNINASQEAKCDTENTIITLTAEPTPVSAIGNYSYSWNIQGNPTILGTNTTLDVSPSTTTIYEVTITDNGLAAGSNSATDNQTITVGITPQLDLIDNVEACFSYTLPTITGNHLSGYEVYSDDWAGAGNRYPAGSTISFADYQSYPITLYVYDENTGSSYVCPNEVEFTLTLTNGVTADSRSNVTDCFYTLPALSPNNNYYTETNGGGTQLNAGDTISTTQTIYIYTEIGTAPNTCSDENSFVVTIDNPIMVDKLQDVTECEEYVLPLLTNGNYFTESDGMGTELYVNDVLLDSQTVYIYFESGTCSDESSFIVTINATICEEPTPEEETCKAEFPKFITPNGDDINDRFSMLKNDCNFNGELRIYDRYARLLFQTKNLNQGWDGSFNGTQLPSTDYWYQYIDNATGEIVTSHFALKR